MTSAPFLTALLQAIVLSRISFHLRPRVRGNRQAGQIDVKKLFQTVFSSSPRYGFLSGRPFHEHSTTAASSTPISRLLKTCKSTRMKNFLAKEGQRKAPEPKPLGCVQASQTQAFANAHTNPSLENVFPGGIPVQHHIRVPVPIHTQQKALVLERLPQLREVFRTADRRTERGAHADAPGCQVDARGKEQLLTIAQLEIGNKSASFSVLYKYLRFPVSVFCKAASVFCTKILKTFYIHSLRSCMPGGRSSFSQ